MESVKKIFRLLAARKRIVSGVAIVLVAIFMVVWLSGAFGRKIDPASTAKPSELDVPIYSGKADVLKVRVPVYRQVSGKIVPVHEAQIAAQIMERIVEVKVLAGQQVKKGDLLVKLDDTVLRSRSGQADAAMASASAARDQAEKDLKNIKSAFDRGAATQTELDRAQTAIRTTEADLQLAEKTAAEAAAKLQFTEIRSPMNGTVIDKYAEVGSTASVGQVLVTIYDSMQMLADVPESLASYLRVGQDVKVHIDQLNMDCIGQISEIIPESDPVTRTFPVKVSGSCHPGVRKGMYARLFVAVDQEDVIGVPPEAIWRIGQLDVAYVLDRESPQRQVIRLGKTVSTDDGRILVEVLSGLNVGQKVAIRQVTTKNAD